MRLASIRWANMQLLKVLTQIRSAPVSRREVAILLEI